MQRQHAAACTALCLELQVGDTSTQSEAFSLLWAMPSCRETQTGRRRTARSLSPYSTASSSISGAIMRHGPHQGAQKSTITGTGLLSTSSSKVVSFTGPAAGPTE